MKSKKRIFVITDVEAGWDNVRGVFEADSEKVVREHLLAEKDYMSEEEFDDRFIIHSVYNGVQRLKG